MSEFSMRFDTLSKAFGENVDTCSLEIAKVLASVSIQIERGCKDGDVLDSYGNRIGEWYLST